MINIDRIIQTNIPDIAPVYGGVRGRTMSSSHQSYAWPTLVEAGVKRVIDLRDVDSSNKLPFLCDKYGMEYFHYPVNNHAKQVESMVALMPQFCEMIDKGDFYIACAMGLHRTDIALCTYWVFYAADKGTAPPPIRGYRQEDGHNTSKIMYVLNSIYKYMTEQNGVEPIPMETFKARKKVINELSKEKTEHEDVPLKRVYVDMDGVLADFESGLAKVDDEVKKEYLGRFDEIPGLFSLMYQCLVLLMLCTESKRMVVTNCTSSLQLHGTIHLHGRTNCFGFKSILMTCFTSELSSPTARIS